MIRRATVEDIQELVEVGEQFYNYAAKGKGLGFDPKGLEDYLHVLHNMGTIAIFVMEEDGKIIGSIAGIVSPWYLDPSVRIVQEHWWWILPDHRGAIGALRMENTLSKWGKELGATKIIMSSIDSPDEESVKEYYKKRGYSYMETNFIKDI